MTTQYFQKGQITKTVKTTLSQKQLLDIILLKYGTHNDDKAKSIHQKTFNLVIYDILTYLKKPQPKKDDYLYFDKLAQTMMNHNYDGFYTKQDLINVCNKLFGMNFDITEKKSEIPNNYTSKYFKNGKIIQAGQGQKLNAKEIQGLVLQHYKQYDKNNDKIINQENFRKCIQKILSQEKREIPTKQDHKYFYESLKPKKQKTQNGTFTAKDMFVLLQMIL